MLDDTIIDVKALYSKAKIFATSSTAKDTYILFTGNFFNAFLGFIFTWLVARALSVDEFGVFSAVNNLVFIVIPLTDLGTTTGLVRFVADLESKGKFKLAQKFIKAAFMFKLMTFLLASILLVLFAKYIAPNLLATNDHSAVYWVVLISLGMFMSSFIPHVLYAKKKFLKSAIVDISYGAGRVLFVLAFLIGGGLTLRSSFEAFALAGLVSLLIVGVVHGYSFIKVPAPAKIYKELITFSGWLGVNKIISALASRVDVQLLALLSTASAIGYYSIANRLAFFISFLAASFSAVIAPRLSAFNNKEAEFTYIKKATLALIPVCIGVVFWVIIAEPFIAIFGEQYMPAVNVFRVLALSMIPFLLTAPSVSAIIYSIKKPKYIGYFSVFQLISMLVLNVYLIPHYGAYGPAIAFGIIHTLLAVYSWGITIRYYRI